MAEEKTYQIHEQDIDTESIIGLPFKVLLFNDDWHTFDDVINQLVKAIRCSTDKARDFAFEVHIKGKACVYLGELQKCLKVSSILEEISLHTQVVS